MPGISLRKLKENLCFQTFLWALCLSVLIFLPLMIFNKGYFFFYGDFNYQQIPFYQMIHDSIQNGNIGWSYTTDLGANIIGSYSFYLLGSPFFLITLLFPSTAVPYLMAPLLMLKFAFAAMFAYLFLSRYVTEQRYAMFGALIYAFSGFGIYHIFFNHFHEAMICFPMMLTAIDMYIYDKKRYRVLFSVFLAALTNYYFFAGQAVFIFVYWCFRMVSKSYHMSWKEFFGFVFEILTGFLCAGVILVPSVLTVMQNTRVSETIDGWDSLVYAEPQKYISIAVSFFFPPDMPAYPNFTADAGTGWSSVAAWLPLFSMVGVMAFYSLKTQKWLRMLVPVLLITAFVPVFNSVFQLFNAQYYARWFYMLTLMLSLATVISLDRQETQFTSAYLRTFLITAVIALLIGFTFNGTDFGLANNTGIFWLWTAIALISLVLLGAVLCMRSNRKLFIRRVSVILSVLIVVYANLLIGIYALKSNYRYDFIADTALGGKELIHQELDDINTVRSDFHSGMRNMGMYWQIPSIQAFHSIVPASVTDFYRSIGSGRDVYSNPKSNVYGIRSFLSVKYLFDYTEDGENFADDAMPGWEYLEQLHHYDVYENKYYIPYGFTYDEYITEEEYDTFVDMPDRHLLLLKAAVLSEKQAKQYDGIMKHADYQKYVYTEEQYYTDCENRRKHTCDDLRFDNNRISASFTSGSSEELVVFSIPYEEGWSAEVNGKKAKIDKISTGFMAVKVPAAQTSEIVFHYSTPGLPEGAVLSAAGGLLTGIYFLLGKRRKSPARSSTGYIEDYPLKNQTFQKCKDRLIRILSNSSE